MSSAEKMKEKMNLGKKQLTGCKKTENQFVNIFPEQGTQEIADFDW